MGKIKGNRAHFFTRLKHKKDKNKVPQTLPSQNDVEYLRFCKHERLNSPSISPEERDLLDMKIRLNDGNYGYVFSVSKYQQKWIYTCFVCKAKNMIEGEFKQHLKCERHRSRMKMTVHFHHKFVLKEENSLIKNNEIVEDESKTVCRIQSALDEFKGPLVGLEYLLEIIAQNQQKTQCTYFCMLCSTMLKADDVFSHLTCHHHIMCFLVMFFPLAAKRLKPLRKSFFNTFKALCTHLSTVIELVQGRLKPMQVNLRQFSHSNKAPLLEKIDRGRHIRETPDHSFIECVERDHLTPGVCPVLVSMFGALNTEELLSLEPPVLLKKDPAAEKEREENQVLGGNPIAGLSVEPAIKKEPAAEKERAENEGKYQLSSTFHEPQSLRNNTDGLKRANERCDDVNFGTKSERDSVHRPGWTPTDIDVDFTSANTFTSRVGPSEQLLRSKNTVENDDVVAILKQLLVLENQLGCLGPKVQELLSKVIRMKRLSGSSLNLILSDVENCNLLETVNQKLLGFLEIGVLQPNLAEKATNVVEKITELLKVGTEEPKVDEKPTNSERYPHVGDFSRRAAKVLTISEIPNFIEKQYLVERLSFAEKERLSKQVCSYFNNVNKFKASEDELLEILNRFLRPREESNSYRSRSCGSSQTESLRHYRDSSNSERYWTRDYDRTASTSTNASFQKEDFYRGYDGTSSMSTNVPFPQEGFNRGCDGTSSTSTNVPFPQEGFNRGYDETSSTSTNVPFPQDDFNRGYDGTSCTSTNVPFPKDDFNRYQHSHAGNDPYGFKHRRYN